MSIKLYSPRKLTRRIVERIRLPDPKMLQFSDELGFSGMILAFNDVHILRPPNTEKFANYVDALLLNMPMNSMI